MPTAARVLGMIAVSALLVLGAAGVSGFLAGDDYCMPTLEGSSSRGEARWTPPGLECFILEPSGRDAEGRFAYEGASWQEREGERTGSWPDFLGAALAGFAVVGLAVRRRPAVPTWLRLAAVTTLALAGAGAVAIVGAWQGSLVLGAQLAIPIGFAADAWLRPARGSWRVGFSGAAVAFTATVVASFGWLFEDGLLTYGLTILAVAALAAFPTPRRSLAQRAFG